MGCTTILAGKKATYDGSTLMARNEDSGAGNFEPKRFAVVCPKEQPKIFVSEVSGVTIPLPENPMRYTSMPNAIKGHGIWGESGFNELNVAMSATETITWNERVKAADPVVEGGIGEEDMLTIVLPYIKSAREGVYRLGQLIREYGTHEIGGIGFQDENEIWWFEIISGHRFMAKRVPDECYVVVPNQRGIDYFDLKDAYSEQKEHICSDDLIDFINEHHLDCTFHEEPLSELTDLDVRAVFGTHDESDHVYNTCRAWFMERYLNPNTFDWDGDEAYFRPDSDDIPWCLVPEKKITIEDVKYVLSGYYQGTPYDPYAKHIDHQHTLKLRPIGINRNNFMHILQLRPYVPEEIKAVEWLAVGSNAFNQCVPFYCNVNDTPQYLRDTTGRVTSENFYWENRIIGALCDAHYDTTKIHYERYANALMSKCHGMIHEFDQKYMTGISEEVTSYLENCNKAIANEAKALTDDFLEKVLYTSSLEMKNAFSRSDA